MECDGVFMKGLITGCLLASAVIAVIVTAIYYDLKNGGDEDVETDDNGQ